MFKTYLRSILQSGFMVGILALLLVSSRTVFAGNSFSVRSRIEVSTDTANPTRLLSANPQADKTIIQTGYAPMVYSESETGPWSTDVSTGNSRIPENASWSPDGPLSPYMGNLWAVTVGTGSSIVDVQQSQ